MSRIRTSGFSRRGDDCRVEISGLTQLEAETLESMIRGLCWVSVTDGRLVSVSRHEPLPDPIEDSDMAPFWSGVPMSTQRELIQREHEPYEAHSLDYVHYTIGSLGAATGEYQANALKLTAFGFHQMRSKRGDDGRYWEFWYLPGVWAAKGELKDLVDKVKAAKVSWSDPNGEAAYKKCHESVLEFLRTSIDFGSLEVSIQRYALCNGD
jgi:hypothetical protein